MNEKRNEVEIYTDGSYFPEDGVGGYAYILTTNGETEVFADSARNTNSYDMELTAILTALKAVRLPANVMLNTDVKGLVRIVNSGGLKKRAKTPRKGKGNPLLLELWELLESRWLVWTVRFNYVSELDSDLLLTANYMAKGAALQEGPQRGLKTRAEFRRLEKRPNKGEPR